MYVITKEEFLAGWISGMIGITIGHPFDTVKVKQQISKKHILGITSDIFRTSGIKGFFRGLGVPVISAGIVNSAFFGVYANMLRFIQHMQGLEDVTKDTRWGTNIFLAGLVGGFSQCFVANPVDVIKIRLQTRNEFLKREYWKTRRIPLNEDVKMKVGIYGIVKEIYKLEGINGFYRGFFLMLLRDTPSFGIYMLTFESLDKLLSKFNIEENFKYCFAGSCAGIMSWIFVIPIDVCKSRIQSGGKDNQKYSGIVHCLRDTYKQGGIRLLMKGTSLLFMRAVPLNASLFLSYKKSMQVLRPPTVEEPTVKS